MSMIKDALQYIVGLQGGHELIEQKGRTYMVDKDGKTTTEFLQEYQAELKTSTLSSIVDYFAGDPDKVFGRDKNYIIRVAGIDQIKVLSQVSGEMRRDRLLDVEADLPRSFPFDSYMDLEQFNILLQARFLPTEDRQKLLALTGNVVDETVKSYGDDGVSQQATVKSGVASAANVVVPNPVTLMPYRTFAEAQQPESKFIFRLRKIDDGVTAALIEADGGAWKVQAIKNIADYLDDQLEDVLAPELMKRITILS